MASEGVHAVALKVYQPGSMSPEALSGRAAQVRSAAHPAVARWLDGGLAGDATWLALELVDGIPITQVIESGEKIEAAVATYVASELVSAIEVLTSRGIAHGRLDPSVVLVNKDGRVKIMGLDGQPSEADPDYVAPEVAAGSAPNASSDVFSTARVMRAIYVIAKDRPKAVSELLMRSEGDPATRPTPAELRMGLGVIDRVRGAQAMGGLVTRLMANAAPAPKKSSQWGEDAGGDKTSVDAVDPSALAASLAKPEVVDPDGKKKPTKWEESGDTSFDVVDSSALADSLRPQAADALAEAFATPVPATPPKAAKPPTAPSPLPTAVKPVTPLPQTITSSANSAPRPATPSPESNPDKIAPAGEKKGPQWGVAERATPPKVQLTAVSAQPTAAPAVKVVVPKDRYKPQVAGTGSTGVPVWARILVALGVGAGIGTVIFKIMMG